MSINYNIGGILLHPIFLNGSLVRSWRCNTYGASLVHIWWNCDHIKPFWRLIQNEILKFTGYSLPFEPRMVLLHNFSVCFGLHKHKLFIMNALISAKTLLVTSFWRGMVDETKLCIIDELVFIRVLKQLC